MEDGSEMTRTVGIPGMRMDDIRPSTIPSHREIRCENVEGGLPRCDAKGVALNSRLFPVPIEASDSDIEPLVGRSPVPRREPPRLHTRVGDTPWSRDRLSPTNVIVVRSRTAPSPPKRSPDE